MIALTLATMVTLQMKESVELVKDTAESEGHSIPLQS